MFVQNLWVMWSAYKKTDGLSSFPFFFEWRWSLLLLWVILNRDHLMRNIQISTHPWEERLWCHVAKLNDHLMICSLSIPVIHSKTKLHKNWQLLQLLKKQSVGQPCPIRCLEPASLFSKISTRLHLLVRVLTPPHVFSKNFTLNSQLFFIKTNYQITISRPLT